jgi:uncharacterized protein YdaU (DUF1376 family)
MNALPYYKAYPRDFIEGTVGMPFEVKCAYRVILDLIYLQNGNLPDDARYISGQLGCSVRMWNGIRKALIAAGKIFIREGAISNFRADNELETSRKFQEKQSENRRHPNKNNELQSPRSHHTEPDTDTVDSPDKSEIIIEGVGADAPSSSKYAFEAKNIRLIPRHLEAWKRANPHIQVESALWSLDEWAGTKGKDWFNAVAGALAKREQEAMRRIQMASLPKAVDRRLAPDPRI